MHRHPRAKAKDCWRFFATYYNKLQHSATPCNTIHHTSTRIGILEPQRNSVSNLLQTVAAAVVGCLLAIVHVLLGVLQCVSVWQCDAV
jgi:hypothetical protein